MIDDLDFTSFDLDTEASFNDTFMNFLNAKNIDVISFNKHRYIRANLRDVIKRGKHDNTIDYIHNHAKQVEINNLSTCIKQPHELLGYTNKTSIQTLVDKHIPYFKSYGSFAYSCSCGSGKTIAGLQIMSSLQCKTLIISSRNAVNDQWDDIIYNLYPELVVQHKNKQYQYEGRVKNKDPDVWICTPQWLAQKLDKVTMHPSLIIFDEVHSLLSKQFIKVLMWPMMKVIAKQWSEMPYMVALSATYPSMNSKEYKSLVKLFGKAFRAPSEIVNIPVYVYDYYDHVRAYQTVHGEDGKCIYKTYDDPDKVRGMWDKNYHPPDDSEIIEYFCDVIEGCNKDFKMIVDGCDANYVRWLHSVNKWSDNIDVWKMYDDYCHEVSVVNEMYSLPHTVKNNFDSVCNNNDIDTPVNDVTLNNDVNNIDIDTPVNDVTLNNDVNNNNIDTLNNDVNNNIDIDTTNNIDIDILHEIQHIDPCDAKYKGLIMTYTIDSSVYGALHCHHRWCADVIIIRSVDEKDIYIPGDEFLDYEFNHTITLNNILNDNIGYRCEYKEYIDKASIIVGTFHRLKEGFSVQNITWGICTKFVWSYISRVQLVGRIRRSSDDPELNSRKRILLTCSGKRPSTINIPKAKPPHKWKYDMNIEKDIFESENYIRV